jgi:hypothetical protein
MEFRMYGEMKSCTYNYWIKRVPPTVNFLEEIIISNNEFKQKPVNGAVFAVAVELDFRTDPFICSVAKKIKFSIDEIN